MPRWKTTENILSLSKDGEFFDENWMNYDHLWQYAPQPIMWNEKRPIKFEDVDLWEVITELSGPFGVYAAYQPYAEYYIVMIRWSLFAEFQGKNANSDLEKFLITNKIPYPKTDNNDQNKEFFDVDKKLIISNKFVKK